MANFLSMLTLIYSYLINTVKLKTLTSLPVLFCLSWISVSASISNGVWTNTNGGQFGTGSNWSNSFVPDQDTLVVFDVNPTTSPDVTLNANQTIDRIEFRNTDSNFLLDLEGNTLTVDKAGPGPASFVLAPNVSEIATVKIRGNVIGSALNVDHLTEIGNTGTGSLTIQEFPFVFTTQDLNIGVNSTGDGLLVIRDGAGFIVNNDVSTNDAILGVNASSMGEISIEADNESGDANLDVNGRFVVGGSGSGLLTLSGNPDTAHVDVGGDMILGFNSGSSGDVVLYDDASIWITGDLQVGLNGQGTVDIYGGGSSGGYIEADNIFVGTVGPTGPPTNQVNIHYDGTLYGDTVTVGTNGVIEMFTTGVNQSELQVVFDLSNYGIIKGAGKIITDFDTFHNYGTIAPDTVWPLDVENHLVFETGSKYEVTILDAIDWSILNVDGDLSFSSGSLDIILTGGTLPQFGEVFEVLTWTGTRTGQFGSIDDEFGFSGNLFFQPVYNSNSLELQVVPEPSTWALMGLGCLFIFWRVQRRS